MGQGRRRTRWAGIGAIVAAALALTGCTGARSDFSQEFRGDPAIAEMELTTGDNMPFTDGVRAEVTLSHDLAHADTAELLTRLSAFIREHGDEPVRVSVTAPAGDITLPVFGDDAVTAAAVTAASDIAADPLVTNVTLRGPSQDSRITGVGIVIEPDLATAFALAHSAPERLAPLAGPGGAYVSVSDSGLAIRLEGAPGQWLDDTESSWAQVNPAFPVIGVRGDQDRITLILENEADVPGAQAIVQAVAPPPLIPVHFGSPLVQLGQNGTGDEVRVMLAQLDAPTLALIRLVWTTDSRAVFRAANDADAATLERALAQLPEEARGGLEVEVDVEKD
ncbi:hypothetical protein [Microbacterium sp. ZW T5_56]|uniref:hypothetical protein n=1 Tax=Microbacterium sp. ZW T5_56 TaxID=3378081 RepID=UPI003852A251